jgi:hypothetical protein
MKADITLDWEEKTVTIYINESNQGSANFYHEEVESVDSVLLYNLSPDTQSWWKNIEVCKGRCASMFSNNLKRKTLTGVN